MNGVAVQEDDINMLQCMFDHLEITVIRKVLVEANGNVDRAVDSLLNLAAIDTIDSPSPSTAPKKDQATNTENNKNSNGSTNNTKMQEDQDALLAAVLFPSYPTSLMIYSAFFLNQSEYDAYFFIFPGVSTRR